MHAIRTILHPTDFSHESTRAFEAACGLAAQFQARLILLYVTSEDPGQAPFPWPEPADRAIAFERRTATGDPTAAILHAALYSQSDLIVMGTHGRTGLKRVLMGSVAEGVLRKAECPVLTVRPQTSADAAGSGHREPFRIRSILNPTDLAGGASDFAFETAYGFAEAFSARLVLLHVIPPSAIPMPGSLPIDALKPFEGQDSAKGRFAWPQPPNRTVAVEHRVAEGNAFDEIQRVAEADACDLIVIPTRGRTGLKRALETSVAELLVRNAAAPVLTLKVPKRWTSSVRHSASAVCGDLADVRPIGRAAIVASAPRTTLLKTDGLELIRLCVPMTEGFAETVAEGESLLQCLEGRAEIAFAGRTQTIEAGQVLFLPKGERFSIQGKDDASILWTMLHVGARRAGIHSGADH